MRLNGKRPTRAQREMIEKSGLNSDNWLVAKNTNDVMLIINRKTHKKRFIAKGVTQ